MSAESEDLQGSGAEQLDVRRRWGLPRRVRSEGWVDVGVKRNRLDKSACNDHNHDHELHYALHNDNF